MDSGEAGGTYTVTWRPPSYSNVSETSCPAVGDTGMGSSFVQLHGERGHHSLAISHRG